MTLDYRLRAHIPAQEFSKAIEEAKQALSLERSTGNITRGRVRSGLIELEPPEDLVIIGDLHGDWDTLKKILNSINHDKFLANPNNKLVLLGDFIDRGSHSIEVLFELTRLKSRYPDSVVLLRGNHEAPLEFPFASHTMLLELQREFPNSCSSLYGKILSLFELLGLMALIQDSLLLVHGGLPVSYHYKGSMTSLGRDLHRNKMMEELLWNDPRDEIENNRFWQKSRRKFGNYFGREVTLEWLDNLGAKILVRGHEPCKCVRTSQSEKVVTLFSSREAYPDFEPGFIRISGKQLAAVKTAGELARYCVKVT